MNVYRRATSDEYGASRIDADERDAFLEQNPSVQYIDCIFVDLCGIVRGKRIARADIARVFESGLQIPPTIYFLDARGDVASAVARGQVDAGAGIAWPVPLTLTRVNWSQRPHGQVLMTLTDARGEPYFGEPRNVLKRVADRFADLQLSPAVSTEIELYLIDRERAKAGVPHQSSPDVVDRHDDVMTAIGEAARTQGLPALTVTPKNTSGQFAVRLTHVDDPVRAGDAVVFLRQIVRALARQHDLDATFMAKPFLELPGNGLHAQVALEHGSAKNAFDDGTKAGSELMLFALGGLQDVMAESMALFAPSVNAYRRIIAARAPVLRNKRWSYHGGATSLRVLGDAGMGRHIEHRMAGADANPYLALAAILAGIHHGVGRRIDPGQPTGADSPAFVDETIPVAIDGALVALENGSIIREYLGGSYVDLYCATKRTELDRFRNHIPAHEYDWYF